MKKVIFLISTAVIILLIAGGLIFLSREPDPNVLVQSGLEKIKTAESFRYSLTQRQWINGQERLVAEITGEKGGGNTHIQGQLAGTEVEMILAGDTFYNLDPVGEKWIAYPGVGEKIVQQLFPVETNPISILQFQETGEVMLQGQETLNDRKCWVCILQPQLEDPTVVQNWSDFVGTIYIDKGNRTVVKVILTATNVESGQQNQIAVEFTDVGENIVIEIPQ